MATVSRSPELRYSKSYFLQTSTYLSLVNMTKATYQLYHNIEGKYPRWADLIIDPQGKYPYWADLSIAPQRKISIWADRSLHQKGKYLSEYSNRMCNVSKMY